jgi:N-acetylmuramoyl-L-alanine amidase
MSSDAGSIPAASIFFIEEDDRMMDTSRRARLSTGLLALLIAVSTALPALGQPAVKVRVRDFSDYSRVVIETAQPLAFSFERSGPVLQIKMDSRSGLRIQGEPVDSRMVRSLTWAKQGGTYILSVEIKVPEFNYNFFTLNNPFQLMIDITPETEVPAKRTERPEAPPPVPAAPPAQVRAQTAGPGGSALRTIVLDPGHGGLECGAKGRFGTLEKEVTLAISLKLKALIERNLSLRVVMTRDKDIDIPLDNRAALSNNNDAFLFISIHANGSFRKNSNGSEVYFLNINASDEDTRRLAYLENNRGEIDQKIDSRDADDLHMILWDMAQASFIKQSSQLAEFIQTELNSLLGTANRGIKQAPFKVLKDVACPAVLVEAAFISNPEEERKLADPAFQDNVAQAIYRGLVNYIKLYSQQ